MTTPAQPSFTPGPWAVRECEEQTSRGYCIPDIIATRENGRVQEVATVFGGNYDSHDDARATARLIAASPSLYAYAKADQLARELLAANDREDEATMWKCIGGLEQLGWKSDSVDFANDLVKWLEQLRATALALAEGGGQ